MVKGREDECLAVIANLRSLPTDSELVQLEYLEVKAQDRFEKETSLARFREYHKPGWMNKVKLEYHEYLSLVTNRSLFKCTIVAVFIMVFQQCTSFLHFMKGDIACQLTVLLSNRVWN